MWGAAHPHQTPGAAVQWSRAFHPPCLGTDWLLSVTQPQSLWTTKTSMICPNSVSSLPPATLLLGHTPAGHLSQEMKQQLGIFVTPAVNLSLACSKSFSNGVIPIRLRGSLGKPTSCENCKWPHLHLVMTQHQPKLCQKGSGTGLCSYHGF